MTFFPLKSLAKTCVLEHVDEDHKASCRAEQFRLGERAIYFPAFPGTQYLPFAALTQVKVRNTALSVTGTCGKQIPMVCLRLSYEEEFYKDFLFEKPKTAERVLEAIQTCRPELPIDRDSRPFRA